MKCSLLRGSISGQGTPQGQRWIEDCTRQTRRPPASPTVRPSAGVLRYDRKRPLATRRIRDGRPQRFGVRARYLQPIPNIHSVLLFQNLGAKRSQCLLHNGNVRVSDRQRRLGVIHPLSERKRLERKLHDSAIRLDEAAGTQLCPAEIARYDGCDLADSAVQKNREHRSPCSSMRFAGIAHPYHVGASRRSGDVGPAIVTRVRELRTHFADEGLGCAGTVHTTHRAYEPAPLDRLLDSMIGGWHRVTRNVVHHTIVAARATVARLDLSNPVVPASCPVLR